MIKVPSGPDIEWTEELLENYVGGIVEYFVANKKKRAGIKRASLAGRTIHITCNPVEWLDENDWRQQEKEEVLVIQLPFFNRQEMDDKERITLQSDQLGEIVVLSRPW